MKKPQGQTTYIKKTTEKLYGIMNGIAIDYKINNKEIIELNNWLKKHQGILDKKPFSDLKNLIKKCLKDNHIDEEEREEILDFCLCFIEENTLTTLITQAIQKLHGVLAGIAIDNTITTAEIYDLKDWLLNYEIFKEHFPFCDVWGLVDKILEDNVIEQNEKQQVLDYCSNFIDEEIKNPIIHDELYDKKWMKTNSPIFKPLEMVCDKVKTIKFKHKTFCFTGPAKTCSRKDFTKIVNEMGGITKKSISYELDYLVLGAQSSPCWIYTSYGRKIEQVLENKDKGSYTQIIHENDFIKHLKK